MIRGAVSLPPDGSSSQVLFRACHNRRGVLVSESRNLRGNSLVFSAQSSRTFLNVME